MYFIEQQSNNYRTTIEQLIKQPAFVLYINSFSKQIIIPVDFYLLTNIFSVASLSFHDLKRLQKSFVKLP